LIGVQLAYADRRIRATAVCLCCSDAGAPNSRDATGRRTFQNPVGWL